MRQKGILTICVRDTSEYAWWVYDSQVSLHDVSDVYMMLVLCRNSLESEWTPSINALAILKNMTLGSWLSHITQKTEPDIKVKKFIVEFRISYWITIDHDSLSLLILRYSLRCRAHGNLCHCRPGLFGDCYFTTCLF